MSNDADLPAPAPELPRKPDPANQNARGRFIPGNRAAARPFAPGNQLQLKHGLRAKKASKIDRRRTVDRQVLATIAAIEQKLGEERLTPQRRLILANVGRQLRDLAKIEDFELEVGIIDQRRRAPWPIVEAKWKLLDNVARQLERLGLDGPKKKSGSLADVFAAYSKRDPDQDEPTEDSSTDTPVDTGATDELDAADSPDAAPADDRA